MNAGISAAMHIVGKWKLTEDKGKNGENCAHLPYLESTSIFLILVAPLLQHSNLFNCVINAYFSHHLNLWDISTQRLAM